MHIPYMKVAIYALTFLSYAYSGYGSSVLSSLRDAIVAAEAVFGDVFKNLISVVGKFRIVHEVFDAAVEENCNYKCPNDVKPVRNRGYTSSADGCGALGLKINQQYLPHAEMETCCNTHDICYDTCNSDKEICDIDFKRCLYKLCESYEPSMVSDIVTKGCKAAAKMLFTGTMTLGCKSYLDGQGRSCYCPASTSQSQSQQANGGYNNKKYDNKQQKYKNNENNHNNNNKPPKYGWKPEL